MLCGSMDLIMNEGMIPTKEDGMKEIKLPGNFVQRKHLFDNEKLEQLQKDLKRVEDKLDTLTKKLEKHIDFIDKTYDIENPIEGVQRFLSR